MSILGSTDLGNGPLTVTVDHDPAAVSTDVAKGSIIIDSDGNHWEKVDDGDTTAVVKMRRAKQIVISADTDALDVTDVGSVLVDTAAGDVTLGGLANGIAGQILHIIKTATANNMILEHDEAAGTQKIYTPDALDMTFATLGGATLVFNGTNWYVAAE